MMNDEKLKTVEGIERFLVGSDHHEFRIESIEEKKRWIEGVLKRFGYLRLKRKEKGTIRRYIRKVTGYSRSQTERLIGEYRNKGSIRKRPSERRGGQYRRRYTDGDIELLARTDELHGGLSGPAIKRILEREWKVYGKSEYRNISKISVSHLYNLRKCTRYGAVAARYTKTKPSVLRIGVRARPDHQGKPGYIRVDSVHQGDLDKEKGVYHINIVDEVTQWEIVASVKRISEFYLLPALKEMLDQFPFRIMGFHSDNGSEFVNWQVADMLNRMMIKFTKSRPRHSGDNGLVETKNGAVVRKQMGYTHIPSDWAQAIHQFYRMYLNPYLNFHRPCFFPVSVMDRKGKIRKTYPYEEVKTPYEKLKSLPKAETYLRKGTSFKSLDEIASQMSDNEFAERMVSARFDLFSKIKLSTAKDNSPGGLIHISTQFTKKEKEAKRKKSTTAIPPGSFWD